MGFSYTEDDANLSGLISARMDLNRIYTKLRGDTVQYNDIVDTTATEFTDLISDSIRTVATENQEAWQSAMMACICAHGVIDQWISDVQWYRDRIDEIETEFNTAVTGIDDFTAYSAIEASHNSQARTAYEQFEQRADACSDMLADGPTPETVRKLTEAGHLGMAPFAVTGDHEYYPYDESAGEDLAERIRSGDYGGNYDELHNAALALSERAANAAQNGEELSESELDFLEAVLNGTDDVMLDLHDDGFRGDPSASQQQEIAAMLGMSIVALSHPSTGGGHDRLPESVRNLSEGVSSGGSGYFIGGPGRSSTGYERWLEDAAGLTYLLDEARHPNGTPMELGEETSLKFTAAVSEVAGALPSEHNRNDLTITYSPDEQEQATMSRLLDFSTANEDANHTLLTDGSEPNGRDSEQILTDLYTFDWNDDGRAVAGLTDWIEDFQNSDDPDKVDQGSEAFLALVETITTPEMQERLSETGHSLEDEENDVTWENVSFTHLNPEVAGSFANLFLNNIESMESVAGFNFNDDGEQDPEIYAVDNEYLGDGVLQLDPMTRLAFAEYIVGSEDAATRLETASFFRTEEAASTYFAEYPPDVSEPRAAGIFDALIDEAIENEHQNRLDATNDAIDYKNQVANNSVDLTAAIFNEIPAPGVSTVSEVMKQGFKEVLATEHIDIARDTSSGFSSVALDNRATIHAAIAVENSGEHTFGEEVDYLRDPGTGEISLDPHLWMEGDGESSFDATAYQEAIDSIYGDLRDEKWPGAENELGNTVISDFSRFNMAGREALDSRT